MAEQISDAYKKHFDPKKYVEEHIRGCGHTRKKLYTGLLHEMFVTSGVIKPGGSLIEIGCGPIAHSLVAPSKIVSNITCSDLVEGNRREIQKWKNKDEDAIDIFFVFEYHAELETDIGDPHVLQSRLRDAIKEVLPCDVHLANPIAPIRKTFDVVLNCSCLDSACPDAPSYKSSLQNVASLVEKGGFFVQVGYLSTTYYTVDGKKFPKIPNSKESLYSALNEAGLTPIKWRVEQIPLESNPCDTDELYAVAAVKM